LSSSTRRRALRVPTGSDPAGTVKLQVTLPTDTPSSSVRSTPRPGWTADPGTRLGLGARSLPRHRRAAES
jgi:uncharacterized protein YcnI